VKKVILSLVIALMAFAQTKNITTGALKIGYVDTQVILEQFSEAQQAQKKLQEYQQYWYNKLDSMQTKLKNDYEEYQKKQAMMTEDKKKEEQQKLILAEQEMMQLKQEKFGEQGEYVKYRMELLKPIYDKIQKAIEKVAKKEGYSYVLDKNVALYTEDKFNLTFDVLKELTINK
jgi:outer membrane protein